MTTPILTDARTVWPEAKPVMPEWKPAPQSGERERNSSSDTLGVSLAQTLFAPAPEAAEAAPEEAAAESWATDALFEYYND